MPSLSIRTIPACPSIRSRSPQCASTSRRSSAAPRRCPTRRTVKKEWQAAWLVRAIECIDLTTLSGDDTEGRVERLCAKARKPLRDDLQEALGLGDRRITVGAVCVYHRFVATAKAALEGSGIPVAAVSTAFPAGLAPFDDAPPRDRGFRRRRRRRDRHRDHPRACAQGRLAGALRRGARLQGGVRSRAHEDDPRHRRPEDAQQCRESVDGGDDGRFRLHQDLDRQGRRQRDDSRVRWSWCAPSAPIAR